MASAVPSLLYKVPDAVWRLVVEFATYSLTQVLTLQQINTHFQRVMHNPIMVSHVGVQLDQLIDVQHMGSLVLGVRYFTCTALPASADFELLTRMPAIRSLDLSRGKFDPETFQAAIASLSHLERLDLSFCRQLVELQALPDTLRVLDVMCCTRLVGLPPMPNLETLDASHCPRLRALPELPALVSLELGYSATSIDSQNTLGTLHHLKIDHAKVSDCQPLIDLDSLCLVDCNFEERGLCAPLTKLTSLTLVFVSYRKAHDLACLSLLTGLQSLRLETGVSDDNLTCLQTLVGLKSLAVGSELISDAGLASIGQMRGLETLYINNCRRQQISGDGLVALRSLAHLRSLHLSECYGVLGKNGMRGLSALTQLQALCIDNDVNLRERWPITPEEEWLDQMVRQDDLQPLSLLHNLRTLELLYASMKSLRWLNQIPRLETLVVKGCHMTRRGLWDLVPCHIALVILGERARATLGKDLDRYCQCMPTQLTFESEAM